jgi:L-ribulokinase
MAIVAGVDYGTQSVRVAIVDSDRGPIGAGIGEYPVLRDRNDPDFATQSHAAHMDALAVAMHRALADAGVDGRDVVWVAVATTGATG